MKKTYIIPETIVVSLMPTTIIAGSDPTTNPNPEQGGTELVKGHVSDDGGSTAGGKNVWDEEW